MRGASTPSFRAPEPQDAPMFVENVAHDAAANLKEALDQNLTEVVLSNSPIKSKNPNSYRGNEAAPIETGSTTRRNDSATPNQTQNQTPRGPSRSRSPNLASTSRFSARNLAQNRGKLVRASPRFANEIKDAHRERVLALQEENRRLRKAYNE